MEINVEKCACPRCGTKYMNTKSAFDTIRGSSYKGTEKLHICKQCLDNMYNKYYGQFQDEKIAVRHVCMKLDLYWSESAFRTTLAKTSGRSMMGKYISVLNTPAHSFKSYDDTLIKEGIFGDFEVYVQTKSEAEALEAIAKSEANKEDVSVQDENTNKIVGIPEDFVLTSDIISYWGLGYTEEMYAMLEQRRAYYLSKLPQGSVLDVGTDSLLRQICNLEVNIAKESLSGGSIERSVNSLNTLLGSLNLKPIQKQTEDIEGKFGYVPMGVWLQRAEFEKPLPETSEDCKDVNGIKKYIFTWMGHLCKMVNMKNGFTRLYEEEIGRLTVERPDLDDDEESLLIESYMNSDSSEAQEALDIAMREDERDMGE